MADQPADQNVPSTIEQWAKTKPKIIKSINNALKYVLEETNEKRGGGYFCLSYQPLNVLIILPELIGEIWNGKGEKYIEYCQEKAFRLGIAYVAKKAHYQIVSSYEIRDPEKEQWGGSIITKDGLLVMSFSGLLEASDEAVMIISALSLGLIDETYAKTIADKSKNAVALKYIANLKQNL